MRCADKADAVAAMPSWMAIWSTDGRLDKALSTWPSQQMSAGIPVTTGRSNSSAATNKSCCPCCSAKSGPCPSDSRQISDERVGRSVDSRKLSAWSGWITASVRRAVTAQMTRT